MGDKLGVCKLLCSRSIYPRS